VRTAVHWPELGGTKVVFDSVSSPKEQDKAGSAHAVVHWCYTGCCTEVHWSCTRGALICTKGVH